MIRLDTPDDRLLRDDEVEKFVAQVVETGAFDGRRMLLLIPDDTRTAPVPLFFRLLNDRLGPRAAKLSWLVALGTHRPLSEERLARRVGADAAERARRWPDVALLNHRWDVPSALASFGTISAAEVRALSDGRLDEPIDITLNAMIRDFDVLLVVGPTFPHEVVGYSGGNKYFFPGISAGDVINTTHWLGALHTIPAIIGRRDTPVRRLIDRAARSIPCERLCISLVVTKDGLRGVFFDTPESAFAAAATVSARVHVVYTPRRYRTVLASAATLYEDIWTAGKCMYKLMTVVEPGGRLIIHAPHIDTISYTHGEALRRVGYHTLDYFLKQWERFGGEAKAILAHSTHVKGLGTFEGGVERPEVEVILATGIPEAECRAVNLGYLDPTTIDVNDYRGREDEGILYVEQAGEYLYRPESDREATPQTAVAARAAQAEE